MIPGEKLRVFTKAPKVMFDIRQRNPLFVLSTINIVERKYSRAKLTLCKHHKVLMNLHPKARKIIDEFAVIY